MVIPTDMDPERERIPRIPVQRRILLLLFDHMEKKDDFEVPEVLSQKGMGRELGLRQTHVSRTLSELGSAGFVNSRSARIRGIGRKRKVYFLTRKGELEILGFIERWETRRLPVRTRERKLKSLSLSRTVELIRRETGSAPSYHEIFNRYYDGSEIDVLAGSDSLSGAPVSSHFYGREEEMRIISDSIQKGESSFIVISSIAGMGKTALIANISSFKTYGPVTWTRVTEWTRPEKILTDWSLFLRDNQRTALLDHLRLQDGADVVTAVQRLLRDLSKFEGILILDDYHRSGDKLDGMMSAIKDGLKGKGPIFLIGTRERAGFYGRADILIRKRVIEIELDGLDRDSSFKILKDRGIPPQERASMFDLTRGHPLALELVSESYRTGIIDASIDLERYALEELMNDLDEGERGILYLASAYEQPVVADGLLVLPDADRETLMRLSDRMLLRIYRDGTYDLHDLLRHIIRKRMTPEQMKRYTEMAIEHLSGRGSEKDMIHFLVLLERAGKRKVLVRQVIDMGETLMARGNTQILDVLDSVSESELTGIDLIKYLILSSDGDRREGREDSASAKLERALNLCDELIPGSGKEKTKRAVIEQVSRIFFREAEISRSTGKGEDTLSLNRRNVRYQRRYGDRMGLGKALNNLALAYKDRGELDRALEILEEAREIFQREGDPVPLSFVEANKADVHITARDFKKAREQIRLAASHRIKPAHQSGLLRLKLGLFCFRMGDHTSAGKYFLESYTSFRDAGSKTMCLRVLEELLKCAVEKGDENEAQEYLKSADSSLKELPMNDPERLAIIRDHSINVLSYHWRWKRGSFGRRASEMIDLLIHESGFKGAVQQITDIADGFRDPEIRDRILKEAAGRYGEKREFKGRTVLKIRRAEGLVKAGKYQKARSVLKGALKEAKISRFSGAVSRIEKTLDGIRK